MPKRLILVTLGEGKAEPEPPDVEGRTRVIFEFNGTYNGSLAIPVDDFAEFVEFIRTGFQVRINPSF